MKSKQRISTITRISVSEIDIPRILSEQEQIISICRKPSLLRTPDEHLILLNSMRSIRFFREQFNEHYEGMLEDVCQSAKLNVFQQGEYIIKQDTYGDTFYIVVKGCLKVLKRVVTHIELNNKKQTYEQVKEIMRYNDGDSFGELALLEKKPRQADVIAVTETYLLTIDRECFEGIMATKAKRQFLHQLEVLSANSILREISKQTVKALFMIMERKIFRYGDVVFKAGEIGTSLYFIIEGEFKMTVELEDKKLEICVLGPNETVGLEEFLDESKRRWKSECITQQALVYKLDRIDYKRIEYRYPDICEAIKSISHQKKLYYEDWAQKHSQVTQEISPKNSKNNYQSYLKSCQQLKSIILSDPEMSFISRDQIAINDDQEVMLKYCPLLQIGDKPATPFQVNTIQQILSNRVQSAGYKQVAAKTLSVSVRPQTAFNKQIITENDDNLIKHSKLKTADSQYLLTIVSPTTALTQPEDFTTPQHKVEFREKRTKTPKARNYNDVVNAKMSTFMSLNPQKIEAMAIQERRSKEEYITKKLYIKKHPPRTVDQLMKKIQQATKIQSQVRRPQTPMKSSLRQCRSTTSLISTMHTVTLNDEQNRIHAKKNTQPISSNQMPFKYQVGFLQKPNKKITIISPISTFMKLMKNN